MRNFPLNITNNLPCYSMREALFKYSSYNWEQPQTQQQVAQQMRNFIAKMNKIYNEIQTQKQRSISTVNTKIICKYNN